MIEPNPSEPPRSATIVRPPVGRMPLPLGCLGMVVIVGLSAALFDLITDPLPPLIGLPPVVGLPKPRPWRSGDLVLLAVAVLVSLGMGALSFRLWFGPQSRLRSTLPQGRQS